MSRTTAREDNDFQERLFGTISAKDALYAIKELLAGDAEWVLDWVTDNFEPEDVFDAETLDNWALSNGFSTNQKG